MRVNSLRKFRNGGVVYFFPVIILSSSAGHIVAIVPFMSWLSGETTATSTRAAASALGPTEEELNSFVSNKHPNALAETRLASQQVRLFTLLTLHFV